MPLSAYSGLIRALTPTGTGTGSAAAPSVAFMREDNRLEIGGTEIINSGFYLVRNNHAARDLLQRWMDAINREPVTSKKMISDQEFLNRLLRGEASPPSLAQKWAYFDSSNVTATMDLAVQPNAIAFHPVGRQTVGSDAVEMLNADRKLAAMRQLYARRRLAANDPSMATRARPVPARWRAARRSSSPSLALAGGQKSEILFIGARHASRGSPAGRHAQGLNAYNPLSLSPGSRGLG